MVITTKIIRDAGLGLAPIKRESTKEEWEAQLEADRVDRARRRDANKGKPPHFDDRGYFVFSSGRDAYCHAGIFSVSANGAVSYGYDGGIDWPASRWSDEEPTDNDLTADDMRELADMMIERWQKFRSSL